MPRARFIRPFATLGLDDVSLVGGKNASLGELYRELTPLGVRVPNGFAITADAYRHVLDQAKAWDPSARPSRGSIPTTSTIWPREPAEPVRSCTGLG